MNEEDKKLLTEYLDECWHGKFIRNYGHDCEVDTMCEHCWKAPHELKYPKNRTFTTWQDLGGLKDKLVATGNWDHFERYVWCVYYESDVSIPKGLSLENWLFNPTRFCQLAADFLKEKKDE